MKLTNETLQDILNSDVVENTLKVNRIFEDVDRGCYSSDDEYIDLKSENGEYSLDYNIDVDWSVSHSPGDYYTPSHTDSSGENVYIQLTNAYDGDAEEYELTPEQVSELENFIKNKIKL